MHIYFAIWCISGMKIPVILIAVEGGMNTIKRIKKATKEGLPIVIVKGSGKASDLIAEYLEIDDKYVMFFVCRVKLHNTCKLSDIKVTFSTDTSTVECCNIPNHYMTSL